MGQAEGFAACLVAGVFFGSNFIPVKQYDVGDSVFFQFIMCVSIWIVGLCTVAFEDQLHFHPLAMMGGALWCAGNIISIRVIKLIGMSMGLMVWGVTNSVMGWASARFGLFGLSATSVANPTLNYVGLAMTIVSLSLFAHVKTTVGEAGSEDAHVSSPRSGGAKRNKKDSPPLISSPGQDYGARAALDEEDMHKSTPFHLANTTQDMLETPTSPRDMLDSHMATRGGVSWEDRLTPASRFTIGFSGALLAGIFFGVNFDPPEYEKDHGGDQNEMDYVFSHFCGILATSTILMIVYCAVMKNQPVVDGRLILPGFACGVSWAIAQVSWFVAIHELDMVIANPIITTLPSAVAGLWGIGVFGEIKGRRNVGLFLGGLCFAASGVIMVALSA